ncbi:MAG: hypothetical protein ACMXYE_04265 [Candidatus Woesearchaeota archaeon]
MEYIIRRRRAFEAGFILYGLLVFLLSFVTDTNIVVFFIATLPVLFSLIGLLFLIETENVSLSICALIPLALSGLFYAIWLQNIIPIIARIDGEVVSVINVISSYIIYVCVIFLSGYREKQKMHHHQHVEPPVQKKPEVKIVKEPEIRIIKEPEHYKKSAEHFSNQANTYAKERDYYKEQAETYSTQLSTYKEEINKIKDTHDDYSHHIQKYIASLVAQIKQISAHDKLQTQLNQTQKHSGASTSKIKHLERRLYEAQQSLKITQENFTTNLRSIEDKCKALNFAIGRVYSDKNGGSEKIRELLRVERVLYNVFSELSAAQDERLNPQLLKVLLLLQRKLLLFHLPEKKLFSIGKEGLKLKRDKYGNWSVLDVLTQNDSDPVKEYHAEASEICTNMIAFLKE